MRETRVRTHMTPEEVDKVMDDLQEEMATQSAISGSLQGVVGEIMDTDGLEREFAELECSMGKSESGRDEDVGVKWSLSVATPTAVTPSLQELIPVAPSEIEVPQNSPTKNEKRMLVSS
jgi:hypothetical protein